MSIFKAWFFIVRKCHFRIITSIVVNFLHKWALENENIVIMLCSMKSHCISICIVLLMVWKIYILWHFYHIQTHVYFPFLKKKMCAKTKVINMYIFIPNTFLRVCHIYNNGIDHMILPFHLLIRLLLSGCKHEWESHSHLKNPHQIYVHL